MDLLLRAPWRVVLSASDGFPFTERKQVLVANPVSFLAQKVLVHTKRNRSERAKDILYIHDTFETFGAHITDLHAEWINKISSTLHARSVRLVEQAANTLVGEMSDPVREASRIAQDRALSPEAIREVCSFGFKQVFRSSAHPIDRTRREFLIASHPRLVLAKGISWQDNSFRISCPIGKSAMTEVPFQFYPKSEAGLTHLNPSLQASSSGDPPVPARSCGLIFSTLNFAARSRIVLSTSSSGGGSPLIQRSGLMRATTNERRYGLTRPTFFQLLYRCRNFLLEIEHHRGPFFVILDSGAKRFIGKALESP